MAVLLVGLVQLLHHVRGHDPLRARFGLASRGRADHETPELGDIHETSRGGPGRR